MKNNPVAKFLPRFCRPSVEQDNRREMLEKLAYIEAEMLFYSKEQEDIKEQEEKEDETKQTLSLYNTQEG